ncbi:MAG: TrbI/VirB10 family protein, partial [Henriciella sp.]|nr:TrbI/VirB10 family protein [Henriciella sp.]
TSPDRSLSFQRKLLIRIIRGVTFGRRSPHNRGQSCMPIHNTAGYAGLEDRVDFHTWRLLKGIALSTLLGVGTELTFGDDESDLVKALRGSAQDSANQAGQKLTERNLNIQPTISIRPGWPLRIIVHKDIVLRPYGQREVVQ